MEFLKELKKQADTYYSNDRFRRFEAIKCGNYYLSIQGDEGKYCTPRQTVQPIYYDRMEIAIFNKKKFWFDVTRSSVLAKFPRIEELKERYEWYRSMQYQVGGYVPMDLIEDLYQYLKNYKK